ncbi:hypothetical protein BJF79_29680 [Actinomadura sp. CNU-125]|uniref:CU044_5270 family protein n=1 Tax=Actinomadura sp. CNU-125 TaxID=1904961 RepID=UPI00096382C0|nr:CU044_5270 family protein [Actinomadura sp. CNU-125]OLT37362.1 hypothetical protein BJF79_29680 [Actinomadura sp. CNU-125]
MDDLKIIEAALTKPGPSADTVDRRRRQLRDTMRGPVRRRSRRPFIAIGVTAATAAAAIAIVTTGGEPTPPSEGGTSVVQMSGPQVLLAAATAAEAQPARSGKYWHVKRADPGGAYFESWTTADGRRWTSVQGKPITEVPGRHPIGLRATDLDMADIAELPTSPAELTSTLLGAYKEKPEITKETLTLLVLTDLLSEVPAPPKVRAAALRALAALPNVKNTGDVDGGKSLLFAGDGGGTKLIVNPKTSEINAEGYADINGTQESMGGTTTTAEWTNELPQ